MNSGVLMSHWLLRDKYEDPIGIGIFSDELIACHLFSFLEFIPTRLTATEYDTYLTMGVFEELPSEYLNNMIMKAIG